MSESSSANVIISEYADDPDMLELVDEFVGEMPAKIAAVREAHQAQDMELLGRLAHQLKGSAGGYGFPPISECAGVLEQTVRTQQALEEISAKVEALVQMLQSARAK